MATILIIDDEPGIRSVLTDILEDENYDVISAADGLEGLSILKKQAVDLVILDIWLPNMGGIDVLKEIRTEFPEIETIMISGHANIDLAVKAVKLGAFDFIEKPLSLDKILLTVRNALNLESLRKENKNLKETIFMDDQMIGASPQMEEVWSRIRQSAKSDAKVLITGENGSGKELIAREIHKNSSRKTRPFIEVNCAAIPDTLIESELFGHEKGAFTSAVSRRKGKFEMADGGTLLLDEVADMSLSAQAKVLRVIQEQTFERVGGEKSVSVDVRIIAATNKNIQEEIQKGKFREDLFFRLNVIPIEAPPLRTREGDIELLIDYFMKKFAPSPEGRKRSISTKGKTLLKEYSWPGNIRELKNFMERINIMTDEEVISAETVLYYLGEQKDLSSPGDLGEYGDLKLNEAKDLFERNFLTQKLKEYSFNISQTAQQLGIYPSNLHAKIKKFGIEIIK
ncbi:MAG: sigma-54-dependent Fis family transcriptional regulator [Spirochaetales bacterium]|nr:sigma-54-dependent Fis family transcriptional regulator [Spirochaetales bacterium]